MLTDKQILSNLGITTWNDMQQQTHAAIAKHDDVLLLSPTGSGKTLAYLVPVLHLLKKKKGVQCLVLVPSRELALQIEQVWKKMSTGYKVNSFYGGHPLLTEMQNLSDPPALLIGTPGRIADHLSRESFDTDSIHTLVLDEFDKSLSLGFEEEMSFIISKLGHIKKRVLVSATDAVEIPEFTGVNNLVTLQFLKENTIEDKLELKLVISEQKDKIGCLFDLLCYLGAEPTLIFCNHREATERTSKLLADEGIENLFFHGGMEQMEREQVLTRFRNGSTYFLVATDLAARGLDIPDVKNVIHYHLPGTEEEFIHRNGRTARMQATGTAYLILSKEERLPDYLSEAPETLTVPQNYPIPDLPEWTTVYISGGKKDKLNKVDIVGFFSKVGGLQKGELGMIEVKDHISYAAVNRHRVKELLRNVREQKMKGQKYRIAALR